MDKLIEYDVEFWVLPVTDTHAALPPEDPFGRVVANAMAGNTRRELWRLDANVGPQPLPIQRESCGKGLAYNWNYSLFLKRRLDVGTLCVVDVFGVHFILFSDLSNPAPDLWTSTLAQPPSQGQGSDGFGKQSLGIPHPRIHYAQQSLGGGAETETEAQSRS